MRHRRAQAADANFKLILGLAVEHMKAGLEASVRICRCRFELTVARIEDQHVGDANIASRVDDDFFFSRWRGRDLAR